MGDAPSYPSRPDLECPACFHKIPFAHAQRHVMSQLGKAGRGEKKARTSKQARHAALQAAANARKRNGRTESKVSA